MHRLPKMRKSLFGESNKNHLNNVSLRIMERTFKITLRTIGGIAILALIVAAVMWLWNLLIPAIIGWGSISYWQALGLTVLFRLLTGHLRMPAGYGYNRPRHRHFHERMRGMSRGQREAFIRRKLHDLGSEEPDNEK